MKKRLNVVLILVVVCLWGIVGFRVVKNYFYTAKTATLNVHDKLKITNMIVERDTFLLEHIDRDPFLNRMAVTKNDKSFIPSKKRINHAKNKIERPPVAWPDIKYFGYIKATGKGEVALLKVNGTLVRIHKGETNNGLFVKNIYKDSVTVTFNKDKKSFLLDKYSGTGF